MRVKIYIEGGGKGQLHDTLFRQGWSCFFRAAGLAGRMPRVVRGRGRSQTFEMFRTAVGSPRPGELPLLLVDSEEPVSSATVWQHLEKVDSWQRPTAVTDDQAFLMVQVMESWFLADRDLLREYFDSGLRSAHLREWPQLEEVPKDTVLRALEQATAGCKKPYSKGRVSYQLLERLNPARVEQQCPHAKALLDRLRQI